MTSSDQQEDDNSDAYSPTDDQLIIRLESRDYSSVLAGKSEMEKEEPALGPGNSLMVLLALKRKRYRNRHKDRKNAQRQMNGQTNRQTDILKDLYNTDRQTE